MSQSRARSLLPTQQDSGTFDSTAVGFLPPKDTPSHLNPLYLLCAMKSHLTELLLPTVTPELLSTREAAHPGVTAAFPRGLDSLPF